ncbi:MAG: PEP/pyruvate-binding domain-containing protein [Saccharospirillum sp.]|nr:PEP/pyruvate-binding domain-containing protein [Saccharospirillum sp.]
MATNGGTMPNADPQRVSTGIADLDRLLDALRIGDNVVWRVSDLADYQRLVTPFARAAVAQQREIIYLRFGQHPPLLEAGPGIRVVPIDAHGGFESFTQRVWQLITDYGPGAFYVFDSLSDLLDAWATDTMVGHFFRVVCPYLYELDTVAYFALIAPRHSSRTLARIRQTTQVLIDIHHNGEERQLQPVKVWQRQSPTLFLPHHWHADDAFEPVLDSASATALQAQIAEREAAASRSQALDFWDQLFVQAEQSLADDRQDDELKTRILTAMIARNDRMLALADRYLSLADLISIRQRLLGSGFIGGKAVGMLLARAMVAQHEPELAEHRLDPHDSWYLGADAFYSFLVHNGCWPRFMQQRTKASYYSEAAALREAIKNGEFPTEIHQGLEGLLDYYGQYPIMVRSSSLLEDGFGNAFAGKYDSEFLVNQGSPEERLAALKQAIRTVYASALSNDALHYREQRGLQDQEEPMALLIQRVNGCYHGQYYLPDAAGVGISRNAFVWDDSMDPSAGMVRLVMGLGTRAVDRIEGDHAAVIALDQPGKQPYKSRDDRYRYSQHRVDVLDVASGDLTTIPAQQLMANASKLPIDWLAEVDRDASNRARELKLPNPIWRLTFNRLLQQSPFVENLQQILQRLEQAYGHPVDIEFTLRLDDQGQPHFNLVQCRPLATHGADRPIEWPKKVTEDQRLFQTDGHFMGGNMDWTFSRVMLVDAEAYSLLSMPQKRGVGQLIGDWNRQFKEDDIIMLIGPGRWGSSSPELGVPVGFADIHRVKILVEVADLGRGLIPDLSYGSHFFMDLVENQTGYVALFPHNRDSQVRLEALQRCPVLPHPEDSEVAGDPAIAGCLAVYDTSEERLRFIADVMDQRALCWWP